MEIDRSVSANYSLTLGSNNSEISNAPLVFFVHSRRIGFMAHRFCCPEMEFAGCVAFSENIMHCEFP